VMAPALGEDVMYQVAAAVESLARFDDRAVLATSKVVAP